MKSMKIFSIFLVLCMIIVPLTFADTENPFDANDPFKTIIAAVDSRTIIPRTPLSQGAYEIMSGDASNGSVYKTLTLNANGKETSTASDLASLPPELRTVQVTTEHFTFPSVAGYIGGTSYDDTCVYGAISYAEANESRLGELPAILLLHGGGQSAQSVEIYKRIQNWAAAGYVAMSVDLPSIASLYSTTRSTGAWVTNSGTKSHYAITPTLQASWLYVAEATAIKAFDILSKHELTDKENMGIIGLSWGGYSATILCGLLGNRVKAGFSVFGSGFYDTETSFTADLNAAFSSDSEGKATWLKYFDAGRRAPYITASFYMGGAANDHFFRPPAVTATYEAMTSAASKRIVFMPNNNHGSGTNLPGGNLSSRGFWKAEESFFDTCLKGEAKEFPEIYYDTIPAQYNASTKEITVTFKVKPNDVPTSQHSVYYSTTNVSWTERAWIAAPAVQAGSPVSGVYTYIATIPRMAVTQGASYYAVASSQSTDPVPVSVSTLMMETTDTAPPSESTLTKVTRDTTKNLTAAGMNAGDVKMYYNTSNQTHYAYVIDNSGTTGGVKVFKFGVNGIENLTPAYDSGEGRDADGNSLYFKNVAFRTTSRLVDGKLYIPSTNGAYAGGTDLNSYLRIYDIAANPECPPLIKKYKLSGGVQGCEVVTDGQNTCVYMASGDNITYVDLSEYITGTSLEAEALANEAKVKYVQNLPAGKRTDRNITKAGNYIYAIGAVGQTVAVDVTNISAPKALGADSLRTIYGEYIDDTPKATAEMDRCIIAINDKLYVSQTNKLADGYPIGVLDISDPKNIKNAEFVPYKGVEYERLYSSGEAKNQRMGGMATDGRYLFSSSLDGTFCIFDTYNPNSPNLIAHSSDFSVTYAITLTEISGKKYMAIAGGDKGVAFYEYEIGNEPQTLEAEGAVLSLGLTKSTIAGYSNGKGVQAFTNGSMMSFRFDSPVAGQREVALKYSSNAVNGSSKFNVYVNSILQAELPIENTGNISGSPIEAILEANLNLMQGRNEITFEMETSEQGSVPVTADCFKIEHKILNQGEIAYSCKLLDSVGGEVDLGSISAPTPVTIRLNTLMQSMSAAQSATYLICTYSAGNKLLSVETRNAKISNFADKETLIIDCILAADCKNVKVFAWDMTEIIPLGKYISSP